MMHRTRHGALPGDSETFLAIAMMLADPNGAAEKLKEIGEAMAEFEAREAASIASITSQKDANAERTAALTAKAEGLKNRESAIAATEAELGQRGAEVLTAEAKVTQREEVLIAKSAAHRIEVRADKDAMAQERAALDVATADAATRAARALKIEAAAAEAMRQAEAMRAEYEAKLAKMAAIVGN